MQGVKGEQIKKLNKISAKATCIDSNKLEQDKQTLHEHLLSRTRFLHCARQRVFIIQYNPYFASPGAVSGECNLNIQ